VKENDELNLLIKGMNKNEKGYFRKFCKLHGNRDGNHLKLFDCISVMDPYSDEKVRTHFKNEKFATRLNATKFYLKNMIIRALRNYYEEQEPYIGKLMALSEAYIMLKKGLQQTAQKRILKEKQACAASESFAFSMLWINLYQRLINSDDRISEIIESAPRLYQEKQRLADQYTDNAGYELLRSKIVAAQTKNSMKQAELLQQVLRHPILSGNKMPLSNIARAQRSELLARTYSLLNEREKGRQVLKETIEWCDDPHTTYVPSPFNYYIMHNQLLNLMDGEGAREMAPIIDKCRQIIAAKPNNLSAKEENEIQSNIYLHEMRMYGWLHQPEDMLKSGQKLERYFTKNGGGAETRAVLSIMMAFAYFAAKKFDKALLKLNAIFTDSYAERYDLLIEAYLLNIMVHLELGNFAIMKRQINLAENFVKKNIPEASAELSLIKAFAKLAREMEVGNKEVLRELAPKILKIVNSKARVDRSYIDDWIKGRWA